MEEGLRGAKNQPSREEGKVPSENGRLERAQRLIGFRISTNAFVPPKGT